MTKNKINIDLLRSFPDSRSLLAIKDAVADCLSLPDGKLSNYDFAGLIGMGGQRQNKLDKLDAMMSGRMSLNPPQQRIIEGFMPGLVCKYDQALKVPKYASQAILSDMPNDDQDDPIKDPNNLARFVVNHNHFPRFSLVAIRSASDQDQPDRWPGLHYNRDYEINVMMHDIKYKIYILMGDSLPVDYIVNDVPGAIDLIQDDILEDWSFYGDVSDNESLL